MEKDGVSAGAEAGERPAAVDAPLARSFLIADVRGYTRFTQTRGDEAAAELAAQFARLTREAVSAGGGELVELRGDEALAVFASPRQAVRTAVEIQRRLRGAQDPSGRSAIRRHAPRPARGRGGRTCRSRRR
jgi:class 3 adenylate cyclase